MRVSKASTSFCSILSSTWFMKMLMCAVRLIRASSALFMLSPVDVRFSPVAGVVTFSVLASAGSASIVLTRSDVACSGLMLGSQPRRITMLFSREFRFSPVEGVETFSVLSDAFGVE